MKFAASLLSLLLASVIACASPIPTTPSVVTAAQNSVYHTHQETVVGGSMCSATAIGPHTLLTASHCEQASNKLDIEGIEGPATIVKIIRDDNDHTIYYLSGVQFPTYSTVDLAHELAVGEDVFQFGFPGKWAKLYRRGYYMGNPEHGDASKIEPVISLFDFSVWHGDSGSGVFDSEGNLIAVVSLIEVQSHDGEDTAGIKATGCLHILFTQSDIDQARAF